MIKYEKHKQEVENRGYIYIGTYTKGEYTIDNHLYMNCIKYIRVKCPYCNTEYDVRLDSFIKGSKCTNCCNKYENSFAYYIQVELGEGLNKYWDWDKNELNPYLIVKKINKKVWLKCDKTDYHNDYEITGWNFFKGQRCPYCSKIHGQVHPKDSFAQYHINHTDKDFLIKYWSDKNTIDPFTITPNSTKKVWIKCQKINYHEDYLVECNSFTNGSRCPYCNNRKVHPKDSFGQWLINKHGKDAIEKYWSDKNKINPFTIAPASATKIWIKCQNKSYHEDYLIKCASFYNGVRCPYCVNRKVHPKDSFGSLYPQYIKYWSSRNKISPYEISPHNDKKVWFYCEDCGEEFETRLDALTTKNRSMKCLNCTSSKGEQKINKFLTEHNIDFIPQKEFEGLIGLRNGNLSYDFYLPNENLLIEYQGEQHKHFTKGFHITKKDFERQQEHDKRKKQYALKQNIKLLEIWYYDYDNIENILNKEINNGR